MDTQNRNIALFALSLGAVDLVALNVLVAPLVFTAPAAVAIQAPVVEEPVAEVPSRTALLKDMTSRTAAVVEEKEAVAARVAAKVELAPVPQVVQPQSWSLLFATGSSLLSPDASAALQEIAVAARTGSEQLKITGSADPRGIEARNFQLSEQRARAVARWLAKRGISEERMSIEGIGEISPETPGEQGYRRARRVEVTLGRSP
jgi:outer membrane protein OmpA-like peptidoglycan-associated protein